MASCFSCCTNTFSYHFENFTFARSKDSLHNGNSGRLQSLRFPSFVSFGSHKAHQQGHQLRKLAKKGAKRSPASPRPRASSDPKEPPRRGSHPVIDITSTRESPTRSGPRFQLTRSLKSPGSSPQGSPQRDPRRHVSFARSVGGRSSSELDALCTSSSISNPPCPSISVKKYGVPRLVNKRLIYHHRSRLHLAATIMRRIKHHHQATKIGWRLERILQIRICPHRP